MEADRWSKGPLDRITLGLTGTWKKFKDVKGGQPDGVRQSRLAQGTPLGCPEWEGSADEWWWPAVGSAVQVDGRSANGQDRRGEKQVQIDREKQR